MHIPSLFTLLLALLTFPFLAGCDGNHSWCPSDGHVVQDYHNMEHWVYECNDETCNTRHLHVEHLYHCFDHKWNELSTQWM